MGFFDLFRKKKEKDPKLLKLQNIVYNSNYDKVVFSKKEILNCAYNSYIPQITRVIYDSQKLVNNSIEPKTFFFRLKFLIEKLQELASIEGSIDFNKPLPSSQLQEVIDHYDLLIQQFLERYTESCVEKIKKLKTDKGKLNKINTSLENILKYKKFLKPSHLNYINNLKNNKFNINFYKNKKTTDINHNNIRVPVNENPSDFVDRLKRWERNPGSEPGLENWYQNVYKKSSMYIDDISKLQSNKNTVDNNLKDSIVFTSKPDSLKFQEEQYENTYPKYEEALECEKNGDYEKALEIHYDILKNHVPIGSSYYAAPISLLEKSNHFEEAIKICDLAIHNAKKYNLHFDASDFENWKNKLHYQIKLSNELIPYIKNNPGILQKDIYKNFNMEYKYLIQQILYDMDKDNKIIRKKHGNSYELYIKN